MVFLWLIYYLILNSSRTRVSGLHFFLWLWRSFACDSIISLSVSWTTVWWIYVRNFQPTTTILDTYGFTKVNHCNNYFCICSSGHLPFSRQPWYWHTFQYRKTRSMSNSTRNIMWIKTNKCNKRWFSFHYEWVQRNNKLQQQRFEGKGLPFWF